MAVFTPAELTNGYTTVTALTAIEYTQLVYEGWVPVGEGGQLEPYFERYISRDGATAGQVAMLQADGTITFQTVSGGSGGGAVDSVNGQTGLVVLDLDNIADTATRVAMTPAERADLAAATDVATGGALVRRAGDGSFTGSSVRATVAPADPSDLTRLDYVDAGDTAAKARATHTGTQASSTISDLTEAVQDIVGAFIVAGTGCTVTYDDVANTFTIDVTGGGGGVTDPEIVRDVIGTALVAGSGIQITVNDAGDSITIASTAVLPTRQVNAGTGLAGGGDLSTDRTLSVVYGTAAGTATEGDDARLSDARTPTAHAASHATGGSDMVTPAAIGAATSGHTHDDRYYTESELDTALAGKSSTSHTHTAAQVGAVEAVTAGLKMRIMTQAAYDGLGSKDATTFYGIQG